MNISVWPFGKISDVTVNICSVVYGHHCSFSQSCGSRIMNTVMGTLVKTGQLIFIPNIIYRYGVVAGARRAGLCISETDDFTWFPSTVWFKQNIVINSEQQFCVKKHLADERGQRRLSSPIQADRKATRTLVTTPYICAE